MNHEKTIALQRQRRRYRVRKSVRGTAERPRLSVFRSHKLIFAQIIDDDGAVTLAAASTVEKAFGKYGGNKAAAELIGKSIAERAIAAGYKAVCFDRGPYRYHGRVAELANAAREGGLSF